MPFGMRVSTILRPFPFNAFSTSSTVELVQTDRSAVIAPATCGVAMDVPLKGANPPPGTDELILEPGAKRSTIDALFENDERESVFVVAPTVTASVMQPGEFTALVKPYCPTQLRLRSPSRAVSG